MKQGSAYFKEEFSELDCVTIDYVETVCLISASRELCRNCLFDFHSLRALLKAVCYLGDRTICIQFKERTREK